MLDRGYMRAAKDVELFPDTVPTLTELRRRGFLLVVVSNQSGIGRGFITEAEAQIVSDRFSALLSEHGVILDAVHWCPHLPEEACQCRKPEPGMLRRAAAELGVDLRQSYMVGDRRTDCEAGERVGCTPVLITADNSAEKVPGGWKTVKKLSELLQLV